MTVLRTLDGGSTWEHQSGGSYSTFFAVSFIDSDHGTIVGEGGAILSSMIPGSPVSVGKTTSRPTHAALAQNYPNPFNPRTAISYQLSAISDVTLRIYDVLGRQVAELDNGIRNPGTQTVHWNASAIASGVYFYRLRAGSFVETRKMLLVR
jgi:hypothetical protein